MSIKTKNGSIVKKATGEIGTECACCTGGGLCSGCPTTITVVSSGWGSPCTGMNDTFVLTLTGTGAGCVWGGTGYGINWNGTYWELSSSDDFGGSCQIGNLANLGTGSCPTLGTYNLLNGATAVLS